MNQIFEKLLQDFKKANMAAKEKMAAKFGFKKTSEFEAYLSGQTANSLAPKASRKKRVKIEVVPERITVHNVHILDASGSMAHGKIEAAIMGINKEMEDMKKDDSTEVTQTIVHFSYPHDIQTSCWKTPLRDTKEFTTKARGATALLQTVGETLTKLLAEANGKDKVLVKIFTDGQENASMGEWHNPKNVADLIKRCEEKGFTVTFVGTDEDVRYVINLLSIDRSNTLAHDNTTRGVKMSYEKSMLATKKYRASAAGGQNVTFDFFTKETGTL